MVHVLLPVILLIVYVLPESIPPHVFVSNSALKLEFGDTVKLTLPLYPVTCDEGDTVPLVAVNVTVYPSPKFIVQ